MRAIGAALFTVLLLAPAAFACSCREPDPKAIMASASVVFDGVVVEQTLGADPSGQQATVIRVRVSRMVKGARPGSGVVTLYSNRHPAACGVDYPPNFQGRFAAYRRGASFWTNNCIHFGMNQGYFGNPR
jgi:hypothetical protein